MNRRIIIVGPSASGKTTVAETVARELGLPVIRMDDFRRKANRLQFFEEVNGRRVRNYEDPRMWDPVPIACKLRACLRDGVGFVAEGNHLLHYTEVRAIDAEMFYIDVPFAVSLERRKTRHRNLPADESFALIGEAQTKRWVEPQLAARGIVRIDGTRPPAEVVARILNP